MPVAYLLSDGAVGLPPINVAGDTTQRIGLGQYVVAQDSSTAQFGQADFVYVKFTGTVAAGDLVVVDRQAKTAVQAPTAATKGFFGLAMAAQTNGCFGYVMVRGVHDAANILTGSTLQVAPNYGSALNAGRITSAVTAGYIVDGLAVKVSGASNVGTVELYWPSNGGR
jgi:hypothetical protein